MTQTRRGRKWSLKKWETRSLLAGNALLLSLYLLSVCCLAWVHIGAIQVGIADGDVYLFAYVEDDPTPLRSCFRWCRPSWPGWEANTDFLGDFADEGDYFELPIWCLVVLYNWRLVRFSPAHASRIVRWTAIKFWRRLPLALVVFALFTSAAFSVLFLMGVMIRQSLNRFVGKYSLVFSTQEKTVLLAFCLGGGGLVAFLVTRTLYRRLIQTSYVVEGRCIACGYMLIGLPDSTGLCPECGESIDDEPDSGRSK